jgi:hypothetical protein
MRPVENKHFVFSWSYLLGFNVWIKPTDHNKMRNIHIKSTILYLLLIIILAIVCPGPPSPGI